MKNDRYKERLVDEKVKQYLKAFGAVSIEGPKWCGKTWTSEHHAKSEIRIGDPEGNFQNRHLAEISPGMVLDGDKPHLIDEWQEVPAIWDAVRAKVDEKGEKGRFILTGSSTSNHKGIMHSGAGRIGRIQMHPMSLFEAGFSSGKVSLHDICTKQAGDHATGSVSIEALIDHIVRGGWPDNIETPLDAASLIPGQYISAIITDDAYRIDGTKRDTVKMMKLLRSLARNESTTVSNKILKRDIREKDADDIEDSTIRNYLDIFQRLFLLDNQRPFSASIRSSVRVKQQEKRHFCDPSLACALLGATPEMLLNDLNTLGFLFEALVERDLRIYAETFDASLYHYQDYKNREIDAVIEMRDGNWCGFEIKLGANEIDAGASNLLKIADEFASDPKAKKPAALCVVCGMSNAAYMRPDGVYVVPVTALRS